MNVYRLVLSLWLYIYLSLSSPHSLCIGCFLLGLDHSCDPGLHFQSLYALLSWTNMTPWELRFVILDGVTVLQISGNVLKDTFSRNCRWNSFIFARMSVLGFLFVGHFCVRGYPLASKALKHGGELRKQWSWASWQPFACDLWEDAICDWRTDSLTLIANSPIWTTHAHIVITRLLKT